MTEILQGIMIPFAGTALGAALVFFLKKELSHRMRRSLAGFAAGVMVAASFFSLLLPALEGAANMGKLAALPVALGFAAGIGFLMLLDHVLPHMHADSHVEGPPAKLKRTTKLALAVTLHNIPEGMAVGVIYAGWLADNAGVSLAAALSLAVGIAIQNFPEGAIVSMPMRSEGLSKTSTFAYGVLSGAVEPAAAALTILAAGAVQTVLPFLLAFAAGAMIFVVVEELIPEITEGEHFNGGTIAFALGFVTMMVLDVVFG